MAETAPDTTRAESLATEEGVLPLREMTLIGTMGTETTRRALIRLPGGAIERVAVGDTFRGRTIDAIEPERLRMSRGAFRGWSAGRCGSSAGVRVRSRR